MELSHTKEDGSANMVDISKKDPCLREAVATGKVILAAETIRLVKENQLKKGDVLSVARLAGISGAKQTSYLIPLCHNILIDHIDLNFSIIEDGISITAKAVSEGKTGVEMEALTAVSIAALTIYDMCKAVDKKMVISQIKLSKKVKYAIQD